MIVKRTNCFTYGCDSCLNEEAEAVYTVVSRGNSGRYCEVMWICADCAGNPDPKTVLSVEQAREEIFALQNGDWADF